MPPTPQAFCADCHATLRQRLADTRLPDAGDFGTLHPQFRPTIGDARVSLDAHPAVADGLRFPHDLHLSSTNGVAQMARTMQGRYGFGAALDCKDCHKPSVDGVRFLPVQMEQSCQMCHSLGTLRHGSAKDAIADLRQLYRAPPPRPIELGGGRRAPRPLCPGAGLSRLFRRGRRARHRGRGGGARRLHRKGRLLRLPHHHPRPG
ncbi:MAG: hypothetical protein WDN44_04695 [Sphingomonas sp.]